LNIALSKWCLIMSIKFKTLFFLISITLILSLVSAEKLVLINDGQSMDNVLRTSNISNTNLKSKPQLLDFSKSELRLVSDSEFKKLKSNKSLNVKLIADNNDRNFVHTIPFQDDSIPLIGADYAWANNVTGDGVRIGVADTGSNATRSKATLYSGRNFVSDISESNYNCEHWHGCAVSSIIAADNTLKGVAPDASIVIARIFDASGNYDSTVAYSTFFEWLKTQSVNVVNNSWGTYTYHPNTCAFNSQDTPNWEDFTYQMDYISLDQNLLLVNSAGNSGECNSDENTLGLEAMAYNVLTVGAVSKSLDVSSFSSRGPTFDNRKKPDITAPGQSITSYWAYGVTTNAWNGTSASAPHVTGAVGLLEEIGITGLKAKTLLINSADDLRTESWDKYTGWGFLNVQNALDWNSYLTETFIQSDTLETDLSNQIVYLEPTYADLYDLNDTNIKCTISWRRYFDILGDPYLQNFDLFLQGQDSNAESTSEIDNVEQVVLDDANFSYLQVYCAGDECTEDVNYALSCNTDFNKITLDYYVKANDSNFYISQEDSNFTIYFNVNKLTEENVQKNFDLNLDINIYSDTNYYFNTYTLTDSNLQYLTQNPISIDLNSNFYPLADFNILIDSNFLYFDYNNQTVYSNTEAFLNIFDINAPVSTETEDEYILSDLNLELDINFTDSSIYYLNVLQDFNQDYNLITYTLSNSDANKISYTIDFNSDDYNRLGKFVYTFFATDVFGNSLDKNITIYPLYFNETNYYVDFDTNKIYYAQDLNDLNITFNFSETKDFNIFIGGLDNNQYHVTNSNGLFYYDINLQDLNILDSNEVIFKDNNRDVNVLEFTLVQDLAPTDITLERSGYNFTISYNDNESDINFEALQITLDLEPLDYLLDEDLNQITGRLSSSSGTHTLRLFLIDLADNNTDFTYTYRVSGGGGGSSSGNNSSGGSVELPKPEIKPKDLNYETVKSKEDIGNSGLTVNGLDLIVNLTDTNGNLVTGIARVFIDGHEYNTLITRGELEVKEEWLGKTILVFVYSGDEIIFKQEIVLPSANKPELEPIDTNHTIPFDSNTLGNDFNKTTLDTTNKQQSENTSNSYLYFSVLLAVLIILVLIVYPLIKFRKKPYGLEKLKHIK